MIARRVSSVAVASTALALLAGCASPRFDALIDDLAADVSEQRTEHALEQLRTAGPDAFEALVDRFDDETLAQPNYFQRATNYPPTIGDACFGIVQGQIEGNWPKAYRQFYVLESKQAAVQWVDEHRGKTLAEMRTAARDESRRMAEAALAGSPDSEVYQKAVVYLSQDYEAWH